MNEFADWRSRNIAAGYSIDPIASVPGVMLWGAFADRAGVVSRFLEVADCLVSQTVYSKEMPE